MEETLKAPWLSSYGDLPFHLTYSDTSMSTTVLATAAREGDFTALSFMGRSISYRLMAAEIDRTARAFHALGVCAGQRVLVCLPNVPQAIYCLYGLNRIGAVTTMVHPLSAVGEIVNFIDEAQGEMPSPSTSSTTSSPRSSGSVPCVASSSPLSPTSSPS